MKRYLKLYFHFFKNCFARELEFRFNLLTWTMMDFVFFGLMVVSVELIFGQVSSIAGWSRQEILILACVQSLFVDFFWTFIMMNLLNFSRLIRHGDFDFVLLKPINLRFYVSTRYFEFDHYLRIVFLSLLLPRIIKGMAVTITIANFLNFILLFFLGIFIFYNFYFMITTLNFWLINLFNLEDLFHHIYEAGRFPVQIFNRSLRLVFTYFIPVAFIATFPVQVLLGKAGFEKVFLGIIMAVISFFLSQKFWNFALKQYSSASS